ncbi:response regulator transcription factor [Rhodocytophaga rosea]|uniref:Response regulator transcription factor n=1 Tax=Rhodocytophaga rosea TaxID=2704465 RepID=A0A6C0GQ42_9BACT|nr:LytTR family DNA-binding domain-containing protein [Rhodocytophaga rosea]QHT70171.1 response regulator transcription factor [Rhodocytophaga rosea]
MTHFSTIIIDDEPAAREIIRTFLTGMSRFTIVDEATNGSEAVAKILHHRPKLIFLDIQMPRFDGFTVLQKVWPEHKPAIIFTTAYDQYALRAFDVSAIDYLLKPFDEIRFKQAIERTLERLHDRNSVKIEALLNQLVTAPQPPAQQGYLQRILVKDQSRMFFVNLTDVLYLDADGNYITLHTGNTKHIIYDSLTYLETRLDPGEFVRIHRSHIVNLAYVREIESLSNGDYKVLLKTGQTLKWTRHFKENLQAFLKRTA